MARQVLIAPSILAADFARLGEEVAAVERGGADLIHIDVMDGQFVPNITMGPLVVEAVRRVTKLPLEIHMMIEKPWNMFEPFVKAGADSLTVHVEACPDPSETIARIHRLGKRAGLAASPPTPIGVVEPYAGLVERMLVMSVNPGFGGQEFIPESLPKVQTLVRWRSERGYTYDIEIDGGIKVGNSHQVACAGVDVLVAGSAIFGKSDYAAQIAAMRSAAEG